MKTLILTFVLLIASAISYAQTTIQKGAHTVGVEQFKTFKNIEAKYLIDVRTPNEYKQGHIEGAKNIDYFSKDFKQQLEKLNKEVPVYVYCRSGGRSAKAMQIMKDMGFKTIYNLDGGYLAWSQKQ